MNFEEALVAAIERLALAEERRNLLLEEEAKIRREAWERERQEMAARWNEITEPPPAGPNSRDNQLIDEFALYVIGHRGPDDSEQERERQRLIRLIDERALPKGVKG